MIMNKLLIFLMKVLLVCNIIRCASGPTISTALDPSPETESDILPQTPVSASYKRLAELLATLNYEGIGLQYEEEEVFLVLHSIFSDPRSKKRQIKYVYTGLHMSYDPHGKSFTVGDFGNSPEKIEKVIQYIEKNIPFR